MIPVLDDDTLYITDNGAVYCGKHCGTSARYTGRDISGQEVMELTPDDVREMIRTDGWEPVCERCGKKLSLIHSPRRPRGR